MPVWFSSYQRPSILCSEIPCVFYILTQYSESVFPDKLRDAGQSIRVERADLGIPPWGGKEKEFLKIVTVSAKEF